MSEPVTGVALNVKDMICPVCKKQTPFIIPEANINNQVQYSMVMVVHEHPQECVNCHEMLSPVIVSIQGGLQLGIAPLMRQPPIPQQQNNTGDGSIPKLIQRPQIGGK